MAASMQGPVRLKTLEEVPDRKFSALFAYVRARCRALVMYASSHCVFCLSRNVICIQQGGEAEDGKGAA